MKLQALSFCSSSALDTSPKIDTLNVKLQRYWDDRSIFNVLLCVVESYACAAANLWVSIVKGIPVHVHL